MACSLTLASGSTSHFTAQLSKLAARLVLLTSVGCLPLWTTGCRQHMSIAAPAPPTLPAVASATYTYSKEKPIDVSKPFSVTKGYTTQDYSNDLKKYNAALEEYSKAITAVRLKVEQNQLVGVFDEIGILFDALKGA